jgi:hypothetical protein
VIKFWRTVADALEFAIATPARCPLPMALRRNSFFSISQALAPFCTESPAPVAKPIRLLRTIAESPPVERTLSASVRVPAPGSANADGAEPMTFSSINAELAIVPTRMLADASLSVPLPNP